MTYRNPAQSVPVALSAQRSDSAARRAADRPLQPIVRPPSLTHIAQVCGSWTIKNLVNAKLRPGLAQVLEETPPTAEQHGRQGDFKLVHDTHVQVLLDHIRSTRDANIATARGFPSELKGTLRPVIDEVKGRPTRADPEFALRVG